MGNERRIFGILNKIAAKQKIEYLGFINSQNIPVINAINNKKGKSNPAIEIGHQIEGFNNPVRLLEINRSRKNKLIYNNTKIEVLLNLFIR